ncbi:MAG: acylphosphatase [Bacteroidia bacterium]|nr:acylphosphatase [Bacteroidia bacterium]
MKHVRLRISGQVQGVGYRAFVRYCAKKSGVKGFVRNEPDGAVYIEAEGVENRLNDFISWCRKGPDFGYVSELVIEEGTIKGFTSFDIIYG